MMTQAEIRQQIRDQRARLQEHEIQQASEKVTDCVISFMSFESPLNMAFYMPNQGEIDPTPLIEHAWQQDNDCYLPGLHPDKEKQLVFLNYTQETQLVTNKYGIPEVPYDPNLACDTEALDIVFVPLVAFDEACHRIGLGAGFYDRAFNFKLQSHHEPPMLIGLAYEFQKAEKIPAQAWDVPVDIVVTESAVYVAGKSQEIKL